MLLKWLEIIVGFILAIPVYGVLIWSYFCPQESLLFGKRWMYKEEPEISGSAIRYIKIASFTSIIGLTLFFILFIWFQFSS